MIVHGDYNLGNVLVADAENFDSTPPLRAILDWEMATCGHPLMDVGVLATNNGPLGVKIMEFASPVSSLPGFPSIDTLVNAYSAKTAIDTTSLPFFYVLAFFKVLVIAEGVRSRFERGTTTGEGFELIGRSVPELAEAMLDYANASGIRGLSGRL